MALKPTRIAVAGILLALGILAVGCLTPAVRYARLVDSPVRAWLEIDGPTSAPPSGIFLSVTVWRLRFHVEWSGADRTSSCARDVEPMS